VSVGGVGATTGLRVGLGVEGVDTVVVTSVLVVVVLVLLVVVSGSTGGGVGYTLKCD